MILMLFIHCLLLLPFGVGVLCWVLVFWCGSWCPFEFINHLAEEERADYFTLIVLWVSCVSSLRCRGSVIVKRPGHTHLLFPFKLCLF